MIKQINIRNSIIVILCITIIFLAIGFVVLSSKLEKSKTQIFNISFTKVQKLSSIKGGTSEPYSKIEIENEGKVLFVDCELTNPHDEVVYKVTIKNEGTIPAKIVDLIETPEYTSRFQSSIKPLSISYTDIEGKILEAGDTTDIKITISYNQSNSKETKSVSFKLGILSKSK